MIEVRNLSKSYGATKAVDDLTFSIQPGTVTGFLGPNGAGKSTTMRMILGLDRPTSGSATIDGKRYSQLQQPLREVGALLDAKWVHPNRSAKAHLQWMAASNRISRKRVEEVLALVGLSAVAGKRAGGFSLGMSQRLGIAGALLGDPKVLLFDEPVNGLDPEGIVWIRHFMQGLAREGRTVLVSSHLLSEMAQTADHLIVIGRGRLISNGTTQEFVDHASDSTVRVRSPQLGALRSALTERGLAVREDGADALLVSGSTTAQVGDLAAASNFVLHELSLQRGSLEQAFMQMTSGDVQYQSAAQHAPGTLVPDMEMSQQ